jgi:GDP-D-mannose 3',5'-epimerase
MNSKILVAGGGGFIGGHLVKRLNEKGFKSIKVIDIKPVSEWFYINTQNKNVQSNLRDLGNCVQATKNIDLVFNLAADMGGMGFIETNKTACMLSVLINTNLLEASRLNGVTKYFFSSSACVYRADKQLESTNLGLKETDAYPANPEDGYGWEKLFSERMCNHFKEDFGIQTHVARFHNVYGPHGTFSGGREKAPAALSRKIAEAKLSGRHEIEIWGDGEQTRSFTYVDDTVTGILKLIESDFSEPINIGSSELISINKLVSLLENISGIKVKRTYDLNAPKGVRGRNSDNSLIKDVLNWEPTIKFENGLVKTFKWIYDQMANK